MNFYWDNSATIPKAQSNFAPTPPLLRSEKLASALPKKFFKDDFPFLYPKWPCSKECITKSGQVSITLGMPGIPYLSDMHRMYIIWLKLMSSLNRSNAKGIVRTFHELTYIP